MSINKAIKKTVDYAKSFGCAISKDEIKSRLIGGEYYSVENIEKNIKNIDVDSNNKNKYWREKLKKARDLAALVKKEIPTIEFLGLTGSVATKHPKKGDDIDLLVITRRNCLWISRLQLKLLLVMKNIPHRRHGRKEERDEFCFNLWLDENHLAIPKNRRSLKNSIDLVMMMPLFDKISCYSKLVKENSWAKAFVKTPYVNIEKSLKILTTNDGSSRTLKPELLNYFVFMAQYIYMRGKIKNGEEVGLYQAFFNHNEQG